MSGWVSSDSKASGYYTLTVQIYTSSGWKNVKSISAKRIGTTDFDIYVSKSTTYRFKLTNTGSKTRVTMIFTGCQIKKATYLTSY
ncbi:hypothetical protein QFZ73_001591 [Peribacillus sp. V2I11]|nr:hypothetical protein [Peribacillus sp. V2I11]